MISDELFVFSVLKLKLRVLNVASATLSATEIKGFFEL
jgi:hypothetical protein